MKKKRILICILLVIAVIFSATNVFAALDDVDDDIGIENEYTPINLIVNQNESGSRNTNANDNRNQNTGNTVKDGNNQMPNTGIEDLPVIAIGICIVSAAIAYTQIKRYNV